MKIEIRRSAYKDLDNIPNNAASTIEAVILAIVSAKSISDIKNHYQTDKVSNVHYFLITHCISKCIF